MKNHSTKRALLLSALAIVMSVAMLIGSTFAWFTDSASTAVNTIQSGTLKIDIQKADGTSLDGQTINFVNVNDSADILWEPGVTFNTEPFYIVNNGSLNLKFQFDIVGAAGDVELLDVISFTAIGAGVNYLTAGEQLLAPGAKLGPIVITGVMDKNAGNQYQGKTVTGLAISLVATQAAVESDSISNEYDKDAVNMSPVHKLPATSKDMTLTSKSDKPVEIDLPEEVIDDLKDNGVTTITLVHTDAEVATNNGKTTVVFDSVELVNQNGQVIDTEALNLDPFTVVLPVADLADGTEVSIYHDDVYIANATVTEGKISYKTTHLCEIVLQTGSKFVVDGVLKDANGNYEIYNANGMLWMSSQNETFFSGKTIKLIADIDCTDVALKSTYNFTPETPATFDGQGYTLYNVNISTASGSSNQALFNGTMNIKNLNVDGAFVQGYGYVAVIGGGLYGNIDNCHIKNAEVICGYWQGGIIAGMFNSGNITNCTVENSKVSGGAAVGAIAGNVNETEKERLIENCKVINCTIAKKGGFGGVYDEMFGVLVGLINAGTGVFNNCVVENNTVLDETSNAFYGYTECPVYIDGVKQ